MYYRSLLKYINNMNNKRFAIVIGHTKLSKGACGINLPCEFDYNSIIGESLSDIADIYYYDTYNFGYTSMVKRNAVKMNKKDYDLVIELHYNAATPIANGTEIFYYFSNKTGRQYATTLCENISKTLGTKNRGAKPMMRVRGKKDPRGFAAIFYPKATTLLLEPGFGSNEGDAEKLRTRQCNYIVTLRNFLNTI